MKPWKNAALVAAALLTVVLAVGCMFAVRHVLDKEKSPVSTPEPVEVETKTEGPEKEPEKTEAPAENPEVTPNPEGIALQKKVERVLASMTLKQKIGQMFLVDMSQLGGSSNTSINQRTRSRLDTYPVGGVLLTGANIVSTTQATAFIQELQRISDMPMFIAVEEEGGLASPFAGNDALDIPSVKDAAVYGMNRDADGAADAALQIASAIGSLGANLNLAPVGDVIFDQENALLAKRSFGKDAKLTASLAGAQIRSCQSVNVSAVMKYFPGMGIAVESTKNGYVETDRTKEEMRAVEWIPYMTGIAEGVDGIMMSNISAPELTGDKTPCSLSQKVVGILRAELGYNGMIFSGALNEQAVTKYYSSSEAVLKAIDAGVDVLYLPGSLEGTYSAVESAVRNGTLSEERIDQSVSRILAVKIVRKLIDPEAYPELTPSPDPEAEDGEEWSGDDGEWSGDGEEDSGEGAEDGEEGTENEDSDSDNSGDESAQNGGEDSGEGSENAGESENSGGFGEE